MSEVKLLPGDGRSEKDRASEIRDRVRDCLIEVGRHMDAANAQGMRVEFGMAVDGFGRNVIARLDVTKSLL